MKASNIFDKRATKTVLRLLKFLGLQLLHLSTLFSLYRIRLAGEMRAIASVSNKFRWVSGNTQLRRWEKQVNLSGLRYDRCKLLNEAVWENFLEAMEKHATVRELHIRIRSIQLNKEVELERFCGSRS